MKTAITSAEAARLMGRVFAGAWPEPNSGCWIWGGSVSERGYARMGFRGRNWRASRLVALCVFGDIEGVNALHRCDNPYCVNPDHLFLGSLQDNAIDAATKRRWPIAKLSPETVQMIRSIPPASINYRRLARTLGVDRVTVRSCYLRRTYDYDQTPLPR